MNALMEGQLSHGMRPDEFLERRKNNCQTRLARMMRGRYEGSVNLARAKHFFQL